MLKLKLGTLGLRIVSALVLAPIVLLAIYLGGWWFSALLFLAGAAMAHEWLQMTMADANDRRRYVPLAYTGICGPLVVYLVWDIRSAWIVLILCVAVGYLLYKLDRRQAARWTAIGILWAGLPIICVAWLRLEASHPLITVFWVMATVWACDIGAYFAGRAIGGPKLAPKMSPNKTWAGLFGGMASGAVLSAILALSSGLASALILAPLGAALAAISQAGDLAESSVKRNFGVKDSGKLIPGHGGIFDRVDGLLFAVPVTFAVAMLRQEGIFPWL